MAIKECESELKAKLETLTKELAKAIKEKSDISAILLKHWNNGISELFKQAKNFFEWSRKKYLKKKKFKKNVTEPLPSDDWDDDGKNCQQQFLDILLQMVGKDPFAARVINNKMLDMLPKEAKGGKTPLAQIVSSVIKGWSGEAVDFPICIMDMLKMLIENNEIGGAVLAMSQLNQEEQGKQEEKLLKKLYEVCKGAEAYLVFKFWNAIDEILKVKGTYLGNKHVINMLMELFKKNGKLFRERFYGAISIAVKQDGCALLVVTKEMLASLKDIDKESFPEKLLELIAIAVRQNSSALQYVTGEVLKELKEKYKELLPEKLLELIAIAVKQDGFALRFVTKVMLGLLPESEQKELKVQFIQELLQCIKGQAAKGALGEARLSDLVTEYNKAPLASEKYSLIIKLLGDIYSPQANVSFFKKNVQSQLLKPLTQLRKEFPLHGLDFIYIALMCDKKNMREDIKNLLYSKDTIVWFGKQLDKVGFRYAGQNFDLKALESIIGGMSAEQSLSTRKNGKSLQDELKKLQNELQLFEKLYASHKDPKPLFPVGPKKEVVPKKGLDVIFEHKF